MKNKEVKGSLQVKQMCLSDLANDQNEDDYLDSLLGVIEHIKIGQNNSSPSSYDSKDGWRPTDQYLGMDINF
ncbi:hypothetical protein ACNPMZ_15380 [Acinetobacter pittii]|uniref:hypothetical protein n=1 Tax=Acinetobacter pittii TaxID=48296 RepID=UPI000992C993|nr:hypothetical protein [Acinetobacter pittii]AQV14232.1 hypothetical protein BMU11_01090 [Acinetobacter pittii]OON24584.1 hypothetical protein BI372_14530 [Acinetobacter pittii]